MSATSRRRDGSATGFELLTLAVVLLAGAIVIALQSRGLTFSGDDWSVMLDRRGHAPSSFLDPHGEHLIAGPILVYKVLLQLFGASSYWPFMITAIAVHVLAAGLVWVLARQAVGARLALIPTVIVVLLGPAWQDLLWAFQIGFFGSVAAGLGAFLAIRRDDRRGDLAACLLLIVSLTFGSMGIGVGAGIAVELLLRRRVPGEGWSLGASHWRRLWVVVVPFALYGIWRIGADVSSAGSHDLTTIPGYVADALAAGLASIAGLGHTPPEASPYVISIEWGRALAIGFVALLVVRLVSGRPLTPRAWAYAVTLIVIWAAAAWSYIPAREAFQSRYQYVSAVFLLLLIAELVRGWRPNVRAGWLLTAATAFVVVANVGILKDRAPFWKSNSEFVAAEIGALEIARDVVDPGFQPESDETAAAIGVHNMQPVVAGPYLRAVDDFGSPADSPEEIAGRPAEVRAAADFVLARAQRLGLAPLPRLPRAGADCRRLEVAGGVAEVELPPGAYALRAAADAPVQVRLRRFGDEYRLVSFPEIAPGAVASLAIPADDASPPWRMQVTASASPRICATPAG